MVMWKANVGNINLNGTEYYGCYSVIGTHHLATHSKDQADIAYHIEQLQRNFLWGGLGDDSKCHLVIWSKVLEILLRIGSAFVYNPKTSGSRIAIAIPKPSPVPKTATPTKTYTLSGNPIYLEEVVREPDFTIDFSLSVDAAMRKRTPTSFLGTGFILRDQNQFPISAGFCQENAINLAQKTTLLEGEAIVAWAKRLFRNNPPNMKLRIESDSKTICKFLIGEASCNDNNLIDFKRDFVVPYKLKVIWINGELNGVAHSLAQYACERQRLESLNPCTGTAFTTRREEVWDYENGFPVGLIAIILEDYGRRMARVIFGSNSIADTVTVCWPMLLDGPCSNARTVNSWMKHISQAIIDKIIGSFALQFWDEELSGCLFELEALIPYNRKKPVYSRPKEFFQLIKLIELFQMFPGFYSMDDLRSQSELVNNEIKKSARLFKYLEEEKEERKKALCQASKHTIDCVDGKLVLLTKYDVTYPSAERKKYLFDELPTHRKFNVLGPERVLKMKRIDLGGYSLIPTLRCSIVEDGPRFEKFCSLVAKMAEDMEKKGDQKEEIEESHRGIGRGFDNSYFWGVAEKKDCFEVFICLNLQYSNANQAITIHALLELQSNIASHLYSGRSFIMCVHKSA